MITALTLNIVFAALAFAAVLGLIAWSIASAPRDRGLTLGRRVHRGRRVPAPSSLAPQREAA